MRMTGDGKEERFNLRFSSEEKRFWEEAARLEERSVSGFIRWATTRAAEAVLGRRLREAQKPPE
ncbi:MAG: DUF1778 domain-containing protein [Deltaproteobacteria bacterium]|nr:DUF1778 domain-containing protein [Deltaproteobacteria bacterium]